MPKNNIITTMDKSAILEYVSTISPSAAQILIDDAENSMSNNCSYLLIKKNITHSDVITVGKANEHQDVSRNLLYYLTTNEMRELTKSENDSFIKTAHQSNITMPDNFYQFLGIPKIKRRVGKQTEQHQHPRVNNYAQVFLVNDSLKYFDIDYTKMVFSKLEKTCNWNFDEFKLNLDHGDFTQIALTHAVHGIGSRDDVEFHKLRRSIFRGDKLVLLLRNVDGVKSLYIMLEKNPKFFTIIGEGNANWEKYLEQNDKKQLFSLLKNESLIKNSDDKVRKYQNKWRQMLASEMMNYTTNDNEVFCPITYISADFDKVGTLFRASHIKEYASCNETEAFDINNGILMVANADALFDKHLITINDDGSIVFSYLLENDYKLKQELKMTEKVFKSILNPKRCEYLAYHRKIFTDKEHQRKVGVLASDSGSDDEL